MSWFDDQPVQRKLSFAMLFTSTAALVVACVVFLAVQYSDYRRDLEHTVATLSRITANNSSAAVAFADQNEAGKGLAALRAEPQVMQAILYDARDQVFAVYAAVPTEVSVNHARERLGLHAENGYIVAIEPVVQGTRRLGTLYVRASMTQIYDRMRTSTWIMLGVLVASFGLAGLLAAVLRRTLARPILELANTAGAVSGWSLLAIGLFNSIMFPTIFTLASEGLGKRAAEGSGVICVAIVGGAIVPLVTGNAADLWGLKQALAVPAACYFTILAFGWFARRPLRALPL